LLAAGFKSLVASYQLTAFSLEPYPADLHRVLCTPDGLPLWLWTV